MSAVRAADPLQRLLELGGPPVGDALARAERRLRAVVTDAGEPLAEPALETVAAGGKRLRPLLVVLAADAVGSAAAPHVRPAAVAVELVHSATLVHDDIIDGAALRRGRPTAVAGYGRTAALATGDLLFSRAFAELSESGELEPLQVLSRASRALAAGEVMQREDAYDLAMSRERYIRRCELKTASLFEAACRLGARAAGPRAATALARFARRIGLAFQLLDDVLDVSGPVARTGKEPGADLLDGTVTLPLIVAAEREPELAALELRALAPGRATAELCARITATGALEATREAALALVADAKAALGELLAPERALLLELVADSVVERYS